MARWGAVVTVVAIAVAMGGADARAEDKIDLKLISRSQAESEILWRKGFTLEDSSLCSDLQSVLDTLTTGQAVDPAINLQIKLFNSPELNAFAMPDGSIFLFVGLLAKLNSREELTFVIGHEATHAIAWHAQKNIQQAQNKSNFFQVLSLTTSLVIGASGWSGAGLIDAFSQLGLSLAAAASITGYSRGLESEADQGGVQMLHRAGKDECAGIDALRAILSEHEDAGSLTTFFWGSHPRTADRIREIEAASGTHCVSDTLIHSDYAPVKYRMLKLRAHMWNGAGLSKRAMESAVPYVAAYPDDPEIHCIIGEAFATSANADTLALAAKAYQHAIELGDGDYREPLMGLANLAEARADTAATIQYLDLYLADDADVPQRRSTRRHLKELKEAYHWAAHQPAGLPGEEPDSTGGEDRP